MKLSLAAALTALPYVSASYPRIAGYEPGSSVVDHNALDQDQAVFESLLSDGTAESFVAAKKVYEEGGHSKAYAVLELTTGLTKDLKKKDSITGDSEIGGIAGSAYSDAPSGSTTIKVKYPTKDDVQEDHVLCRVGGLPVDQQYHEGCFVVDGSVTIDGTVYPYSGYTIEGSNFNGRHIAGFSTSAQSKMLEGCPGCPYDEFSKYYSYYGEADYAHSWVSAALSGGKTNFKNGNADFDTYSFTGRTEAAKKGSAYMNIYMYVIREFEDAIDDCKKGCIECNYDSVHAWDEGVAFYTGSLEGVDGAGSGKMLYNLADKRCTNYKTCGLDTNALEGKSYVNSELFSLFTLGQYNLQIQSCEAVRKNLDEITALMAVPLIQGTMRYAYKVDKLEGAEKEKAEGAVFAASVLPRVHKCNADDASTIYENMKVGASSTDQAKVKAAFENNYECMGINGKVVGGLWNGATETYYEGMEPKKDGSTSGGRNNLAIGLGVGFGVVGLVGAGFIVHMIRREKSGKPIFMDNSGEAIDV